MTYSDIEAATDTRTTPLVGNGEHSRATHSGQQKSNRLFRFLHFFGGGIYTPDGSTYDPIEILLNAEDEEERDRLTEKWRDNRLQELNFVGVVAALLAGVLTSTGSWPTVSLEGHPDPWTVRTAWYCGIILSLFSILTAADQTVRLLRLSSHRDAPQKIRILLGSTKGHRKKSAKTGRILPKTAQIITWQMPVMFLTSAALCMIIGMFLHVWSGVNSSTSGSWLDNDGRVALTFTVLASVSILLFFGGQVALHVPDSDPDREFA
ncbi:hypothetical protein P154DRAFT_31965 [Amniculicola lignicola CBS 123094]|uniref:Uncharacterized protein n=1 Tax=Amniculicola lignicola CBS 123094 TaxID=1392246 RepID=A0A6A5VZV6_9PLEO|nr:hypothetical protein P154DRAFT_31965 [Amniculicola lignicola CBS 123094]